MPRAVIPSVCALLLLAALPATAHEGGILLQSDSPGGGALVATGVPDEVLVADLIFCSSGECLWVTEENSIMTPADDDPGNGLYALAEGTKIRLQIVSIDPSASLKVGGARLDRAGESTLIGKAQSLHAHTFWQIEAAEDDIGERTITFRFEAVSAGYTPSQEIEVRFTNSEQATTTSTTMTSGATCGDGVVEGEEACDAGAEPWSEGRACDGECAWLGCGDPNADGSVSATDALFTLAAAVGVRSCDLCVCDVDGGAESHVSGSDALRILRFAVALDTSPLGCSTCSN